MNDSTGLNFILHVSDFHLTDRENELGYVRAALRALSNRLKQESIRINYLVHTGDIINSGDIYEKIASMLNLYQDYATEETFNEENKRFDDAKFAKNAPPALKERFNQLLESITWDRFVLAANIMTEFFADLNIPFGNVVICCGNHDILRPFDTSICQISCEQDHQGVYHYQCDQQNNIFKPFNDFLDKLGVANSEAKCGESGAMHCIVGDLNVLILNTNWRYPPKRKPGYYCVQCEKVQAAIKGQENKYDKFNIVIAHKPIYEICETARLSYKRYIDTPFMAAIQDFIGSNGIYLCGDKHTRSIVGSSFHDIPHYISGEPLIAKFDKESYYEVEYNLIEVKNNSLGIDRKIHLKSKDGLTWTCELRPQDSTPSQLYELSKISIIRNVFEIIAPHKTFRTWESLCQEFYRFHQQGETNPFSILSELYRAICKFRKTGVEDIAWSQNQDIFEFILDRLNERMKAKDSKNIMNLRGEYSSGKSTFLGLLYLYLMYKYSLGEIEFIPAYFNLENSNMLKSVGERGSYHEAAKCIFHEFAERIQEISDKEHQFVCYFIDGLDEQDCWSYSSEDSVGRGLLDILAQCNGAFYIMAFSQHRLPRFKNTMPTRKYNDKSDILYFNPIDVQIGESNDNRFETFVTAFIQLKNNSITSLSNIPAQPHEKDFQNSDIIQSVIHIIQKFRRLSIHPGFMYHNYEFLTATDVGRLLHEHTSVEEIYKYYIDRQHEICLENLGYGFVKYAPTMAFLFTYQGYTYERFKQLHQDNVFNYRHTLKPIWENQEKIYGAFLFIKKQKDAREYLIALHYNRELRYYAEHPSDPIEEDSILNEFITRNIAVLIRKLWTDTNKFVIVCEKLLQRDELSNCTQSMLLYCLAHIKMYKPLQDELLNKLRKKAEITLLRQHPEAKTIDQIKWDVCGKDYMERLKNFLDLSLLHTLRIFNCENRKNSLRLVREMEADVFFSAYNLQYQRLYYGDVFIHGEDRSRPLDPSMDKIGKGFDFHNCYNYLYAKLSSSNQYPLREFDMYTMWYLVKTRLDKKYLSEHCENVGPSDTFFFRPSFKEKSAEILQQLRKIFQDYRDYDYRHEDDIVQGLPQFIESADKIFTRE